MAWKNYSITKTRVGKQQRFRVRSQIRGVKYSKTVATLSQAKAVIREYDKLRREIVLTDDPQTLWRTATSASNFALETHFSKKSEGTFDGANQHLGMFKLRFGPTPVSQLNPIAVWQWLNELAVSRNYARTSLAKIRQTIVTALNVAVRHRYIRTNPLQNMPPLEAGKASKERMAPTVEQARALLQKLEELANNSPEQAYLWAFSLIASVTAARRGEICALKKSDYDSTNRTIVIDKALSRRSRVKETKTSDRRILPLPEHIAARLDGYIQGLPKDTEFMFPSPNNPSVTRNVTEAGKTINETYRKLGFSNLTLHCWRHGFVTGTIEMGNGYHAIKQVTGHQSIAAFDRYSHKSTSVQKMIIEAYAAKIIPPTDLSSICPRSGQNPPKE